ncbi:hypothetical protein OQA88_2739 [Cercophora sp. LCS_1]
MLQHAANLGHAIVRRHIEDGEGNVKLPGWAPLVVLADAVVFLPVFLIVGYTLSKLIPAIAIVEDPNPPAYEPVALDESAADQGPAALVPGKPITSSLRATRRLLSSVAGWRAYFRGFVCAAVLAAAEGSLSQIFGSFLPLIPVGALLARLALTQFGTAWTHIVMTAPTERKFYQRLPPFKKAFEATCFPLLAIWVADSAAVVIPLLVAQALGLPIPRFGEEPTDPPQNFDGAAAWKSLVIFVVAIIIHFGAVVPTNVLLTRVQASLLPEDEETIVPFDRSFGGKVEPAIVGGKGFVSMRDALATFPVSSWVRIYKLYAKVIAVSFAAWLAFVAVLIPEFILIKS